ncbi:MAG: hypothetical protein CEE38_23600 [Planctomycetes bacterium B3_Pla]|nr:MAG: hypothetical protein CEE38_23600 [Planctomycetes bacterium B3_Pla]
MTAPIETPVAPPTGTQLSWENTKPEARETALRGDDLVEPVETPTEAPKETPPVEEPPETPPAEPPVKAVEPPETPPVEEPVKPVEEPPAEPPKEEPVEPKRLYAGQYESVEEMEKALQEKQGTIDRQGGELGELRKQTQPKPKPEPEDPEPVRDQFDDASLKAHDEWMLREIDRRNTASEQRIAQGLSQYEMAQPVRDMIKQFTDDHKDISPEKRLTIGQHADNMARAAGKPVSLEEAHADLFGAKTETPSEPGVTPVGEGTAEAIQAASDVPKTVSDVPTSPPAAVSGPEGQVDSQAEWNALPEAEREKRRRDIPLPPKE